MIPTYFQCHQQCRMGMQFSKINYNKFLRQFETQVIFQYIDENDLSSWTQYHHNLLWHYLFHITGAEQIISMTSTSDHFHLSTSKRAVQKCLDLMGDMYSKDGECQVCFVNITVQSSFGLWTRWCVAIIAPEQWPQGSWVKVGGKVINYLGVVEEKIGCPRAPREPVGLWMDWQCLHEMDCAPMNNSYSS